MPKANCTLRRLTLLPQPVSISSALFFFFLGFVQTVQRGRDSQTLVPPRLPRTESGARRGLGEEEAVGHRGCPGRTEETRPLRCSICSCSNGVGWEDVGMSFVLLICTYRHCCEYQVLLICNIRHTSQLIYEALFSPFLINHQVITGIIIYVTLRLKTFQTFALFRIVLFSNT